LKSRAVPAERVRIVRNVRPDVRMSWCPPRPQKLWQKSVLIDGWHVTRQRHQHPNPSIANCEFRPRCSTSTSGSSFRVTPSGAVTTQPKLFNRKIMHWFVFVLICSFFAFCLRDFFLDSGEKQKNTQGKNYRIYVL